MPTKSRCCWSSGWWACMVLCRVGVVVVNIATSTRAQRQSDNYGQLHAISTSLVHMTSILQTISAKMEAMHDTMKQCGGPVTAVEKHTSCLQSAEETERPRNCYDLQQRGDSGKGLRQVYPFPERHQETVWVYCDQATDGGGWTVFQRRDNLTNREDFRRTWLEYQLGFGNLTGEFWLGLNLLNTLTSSSLQQLRVDLYDWEGEHRWAKYEVFKVGGRRSNYRLLVDRYRGDAGDALAVHNHQQFSTYDADNDNFSGNCAARYNGGWWYYLGCYHANPNGYQYEGNHDTPGDGIAWSQWKGPYQSLRSTTFMIKSSF